jgi:hypothetical protein
MTPTMLCLGCKVNPLPDDKPYCDECDARLEARVDVSDRKRKALCLGCDAELTTARRRVHAYCLRCSTVAGKPGAQAFNNRAKGRHPSEWIITEGTMQQVIHAKKWLTANPATVQRLVADSSRLRARCTNYGVTVADWVFLAAAQDGKCGICGRGDDPIALVVDHDHVTGRVRGLLCHTCNVGIGFLRIDGDRALPQARATLAYVEAHLASHVAQSA